MSNQRARRVDQSTTYHPQLAQTQTQTQTPTEHTLLFHSTIRPRAAPSISYNEIIGTFNNQVYHETSSLYSYINTHDGSAGNYHLYQPIFGYHRLSGIESFSRQKYSSVELENRLNQLRRAVVVWDLILIKKLLDSEEFNDYLEIVTKGEDSEEKKRRIVKRMVLEHIGSMVQPLRHEKYIRELELNLVILLNSLY